MASILRVNTLTDASSNNSTAMSTINQGTAKVWFNINQEGTQAFRDSFNCSSLSDINTGITRVTYSNALANDDYSLGGMARDSSGGSFGIVRISEPMSTTQLQFVGESHDDTNIDCETATVSLHGDLA